MSDSCVYVRDKVHGWLPANVLSQDGDQVQVRVLDAESQSTIEERTIQLKDYPDNQLPLQNVDASGNLMEMADMVDLPSLHEAAILYNLRVRHKESKPYTRVGDLIIAVNPFQWMTHLYSEHVRSTYIQKLILDPPQGGDVKSGLDPHVYETSSLAYRGLAIDGQLQSILVSGESGAGKTETVKIVMSHLASVQSAEPDEDETQTHHLVVQRVLDSHPLLEAFGNAKTVRNDNSSRFGKFIQMQFDVEDATSAAYSGKALPSCLLAGSTCETYLLEKSRVVGHDDASERTYHIFYQIVAASDHDKRLVWDGLVGKTNESYRYIGATQTTKIEGKTDHERYSLTVKALRLLGVTNEKLYTLFRAVCTVMQLGNLTFGEDPQDDEKSMITSTDELQALSNLMGVDADKIHEALTYRTVTAGRETFSTPLKHSDAQDGCDAFAKEIYQQVFDWLVREINDATCAEKNYDAADDCDEYGLIGLLDIFGFESFEVNRFEQLCINYTNEKLQQKYTLDIFRSVQDEYAYEGIALGEIAFPDNTEVLRLIEGRMGVISILNEECVRPKGNDTAFVTKMKTVNKDVSQLIADRLHRPTEFGIQHYAGSVTYDATSFIQKNTDTLPMDVLNCACESTNTLIQVELKAASDARMSAAASAGRRGGAGAKQTVASKFKLQLTQLMHDITKTKTRYIRCIKPNPQKVPIEMDMKSSAEQLRCAGVVAAVTISRVAFPNRLMHETVLERFLCMSDDDATKQDSLTQKEEKTDDNESGYKDAVETLLTELLKSMEVEKDCKVTKAFECGKSRVYFRSGALELLEGKRLIALGVFAIAIERIARGFTARSIFMKIKNATIACQALVRRAQAQRSLWKAQSAVTTLSCWIRCVFAKMELTRLKRQDAAIKIQAVARMVSCLVVFKKLKSSATLIQKIARGSIQRPKYRQALKEAEEEARVNTKLAALQRRLQEAEMKWMKADKQRIEAEKRAAQASAGQPITAAPPASEPTTTTTTTEDVAADAGRPVSVSPTPSASSGDKALIDESNEMLDYFRKEVFKLKSANYLLRADLSATKEENTKLAEHSMSTEASLKVMKQTVATMSGNNMKLAMNAATQKDTIADLKQELKVTKLRHESEVRQLTDDTQLRDKNHKAENARLKRDLERMKKLIAQNPPESTYKQSRATFENHPGGVHGADGTHLQHPVPVTTGVPPDFSRASSYMSSTGFTTDGDDDRWNSDMYYDPRNGGTGGRGGGRGGKGPGHVRGRNKNKPNRNYNKGGRGGGDGGPPMNANAPTGRSLADYRQPKNDNRRSAGGGNFRGGAKSPTPVMQGGRGGGGATSLSAAAKHDKKKFTRGLKTSSSLSAAATGKPQKK